MNAFVFLGGTCGNNIWRPKFTETLVGLGVDPDRIFDPVVKEWNDAAREREEEAKRTARYRVFYLGSPLEQNNSLSTYSIVEATMSLYDHPDETIIIFDYTKIEGHHRKVMEQTMKVLQFRFPNAMICTSKDMAIAWLVELYEDSL